MPRLTDLDPEFLRYVVEEGGKVYWRPVRTLQEAQGIKFLCPKCFAANGGAVGTHAVICWSRSRGVPDSVNPGPGRWKMAGTSFADLTLGADPPSTARSVNLHGGCGWHGFVTMGVVE